MKTISSFRKKESYGKRFDTVELIEMEWGYAVRYKYTSMTKECVNFYDTIELAMYDYSKKIMFLLS